MTDALEQYISDPDILIRSCLVMCLRRLRHYQNEHLLRHEGTATLVERQQAKEESETDHALIKLIEGILMADPSIPEP